MHRLPFRIKLNTFRICMQKRVNTSYTTIYPNRIFGLRYQNQVLEFMRLRMVWILIPYWFTWVKEMWNTARNTALPKTKWLFHGFNFVMSTLQYIIVLRETHKVQTIKYYRWHGVNEYMSSVPSIFLRKLTYTFQIQYIYLLKWRRVSKNFTIWPLHRQFPFYLPLEILNPNFPMLPCSSSRYS